MFAARGDVTQFRHREVRWEVANYVFKQQITGCDRSTSPLYEPTVHLRFEI